MKLVPPNITPGPWTVDTDKRLVGSNGESVTLSNSSLGLGSSAYWPDGEANTKLVHAAPVLADALVRCLPHGWHKLDESPKVQDHVVVAELTAGDVRDIVAALLAAGYTTLASDLEAVGL